MIYLVMKSLLHFTEIIILEKYGKVDKLITMPMATYFVPNRLNI